ncbi:hypothetical protein P7I89_06125 [Pseudomonas aeruginosa]|nr:hypothetical protein P7I89_06125 [Pseudomonas aeruginosa]
MYILVGDGKGHLHQGRVAHQIEADEVLSIYLDALSDEARALPDNIGEGITPIQMGDTASLRKLLSSSDPSAQQIREMVRLVLNLTTPPASDPRLQSVLAALKEPINGRQALAKRVHLSPTRFSHWFVEQTGLPLRGYREMESPGHSAPACRQRQPDCGRPRCRLR